MTRSNYKRYASFGPGGVNCPCCGPAPGKRRKTVMRKEKRAERAKMFRELMKELDENT